MSRRADQHTWQTSGLAATGAARGSLYRRAVLSALRPMRHGSLTITMPDGETRRYGEGSNPRRAKVGLEARIDVLREDFFRRCFYFGDIGLAESFMAGEWTTDDLAETLSWFLLNADGSGRESGIRRRVLNRLGWINNLGHRLRANSIGQSRENIAAHYDLSNEFFALFLDDSMTYSSALFEGPAEAQRPRAELLERAQSRKYERLCALLQLAPGDRVLEIGGGWGALSRFIAREYGCHVTTVTISERQFAWADRRRREESLEDRIDLRLLDYRKLTGQFDKIVSVEMLEAVGHEYFDAFFRKCDGLLAPNGLMALQVITCPESRYESSLRTVDFIQKHIFPGGLLPSVGALMASAQRATSFTMRDLFDMGDSYALTLEAWSEKFEERLEAVRALGFDETFIRKWRYYLMYCLAAFRMRQVSVAQILLTRPNNHDIAMMRGRP